MATQATDRSEALRHEFVVGLKNAHAMEQQALSIMDRQIEHLARYAEVEQRLRSHRGETEHQVERLERILASLGETHSTVKDITMSIGGSLAALAHSFASDEILKNSFANMAFENFEKASYKALIIMAEAGGYREAIPLLEETLREEEAMITFLDETLPAVVTKYLSLRAAGEQAGH
ncbi:conserved hypothetical protein [Sphingobium sp. SYK-6]|uniref:DUF892 family protein n=1 Tax=Sphingobium sp. (strain NBRC 103272 / SYK-6) TaxID=627192 RepID=UPI00022769AB|nr:DUF892 family protein [Sphingobium sp. SYK-6]BAK65375.1 conserved hypothetical protein [Sphingobium sp. SYK-6]